MGFYRTWLLLRNICFCRCPFQIWYGLSFLLIIQCIPTIPTVEGTSVGLGTTATARKTRRHMIIYVGLLIMFSTDALGTATHSSTAKRKRHTVGLIFHELGPYYTRRAYRMDAKTFWKLHKTIHKQLHYNNFPSSSSKKNGEMGHKMVWSHHLFDLVVQYDTLPVDQRMILLLLTVCLSDKYTIVCGV